MKLPTTFTMFSQAKFKLTFWYAVVILLINTTISSLIYYQTVRVIDVELMRIQKMVEEERRLVGMSLNQKFRQEIALENLEQTKRNIFWQLITINSGITAIILVAGYMLAGKTLNPIATTLEQQEAFVANASHELRTPLTSLQTSLEVNLADPGLDEEAKAILQENLDDVTQLIQLTDRLLKLARPYSHQQTLAPRFDAVQIPALLKATLKTISPIAAQKKQKIITPDPKKSKNYAWFGDQALLKDLLIIILDNSVKYSPEKSTINIRLSATKRNLTVSVTDQGIGIENSQQEKVFDRFYQVTDSRSRSNRSGYGLGLSLAKHIVEYHNGSISLKSKPTKGTKISITIPRMETHLVKI